MVTYHRETDGVYTITKHGAVYAWVNYSKARREWRMLTAQGQLSFHITLTGAIRAVERADV
jgi:hypothetical protein